MNRDDSETGDSEVNRSGITLLGMFLELPTSPHKYVPLKMNIFFSFLLAAAILRNTQGWYET